MRKRGYFTSRKVSIDTGTADVAFRNTNTVLKKRKVLPMHLALVVQI